MAARRVNQTLIYLVLIIASILYLLPVYVVLVTSLKSNAAVSLAHMWNLPAHPGLSSIRAAWAQLSQNFGNSFYLAIPATLLSSALGAINGYALSKWRFRGANALFFVILMGLFIPYQSVLIPLLRVMDTIGLYNSIPGLIIVHTVYGIPITTLIFR